MSDPVDIQSVRKRLSSCSDVELYAKTVQYGALDIEHTVAAQILFERQHAGNASESEHPGATYSQRRKRGISWTRILLLTIALSSCIAFLLISFFNRGDIQVPTSVISVKTAAPSSQDNGPNGTSPTSSDGDSSAQKSDKAPR